MEHIKTRCKHCQKEYTYCTYGNGPKYGTEEGCSREYCAECQKAIDSALSAIPVKFEPVKVPLESSMIDTIRDVHRQLLEEWMREPSLVKGAEVKWGMEFDCSDRIEYEGRIYFVDYNQDSTNKFYFVLKEHDIINDMITNKFWNAKKHETSFHPIRKFTLEKYEKENSIFLRI